MARRFPSRWLPSSPRQSTLPPRSVVRPATTPSATTRSIDTHRQVGQSQDSYKAKEVFACLWLRDFPAWAAVRGDPSLQGHPVTVSRREQVMALSPEARKLGVQTGWSVARAYSRYPQLLVVPHDAAACAWAWEQVIEVLYQYTPRIEPRREGLLFFEPPRDRSRIIELAQVTLQWCGRCGIAPDRATAEMAALSVAAGAVRTIRPGVERGFLDHVPITALIEAGISGDTVERLDWLGVNSVCDLQMMTREQLLSQFEAREARRLWQFARAGTLHADCQPVLTHHLPAAIEERFALEPAATQPPEWYGALELLAANACNKLSGMGTSLLAVAIQTQGERRTRSRLMREAVSQPRILLRFLSEMVENLYVPGTEVEAIEIRLGKLSVQGTQNSLFAETEKASFTKDSASTSRDLLQHLRSIEARFSQSLWQFRLRDAYAPLPEERYSLVPALDEEALSKAVLSRKTSRRKRGAMR